MGGAESAWKLLESADEICTPADAFAAVARVAREITAKLEHRFPMVLGVMRGSIVFAGHLLPLLRFPLEFDYLDVTRYGDATRGGELAWRVEPARSVAGRVVLIIDDILDEGRTLALIRERVLSLGAAEFYSAVFAEKNTGCSKPVTADFLGVAVPNRYVFGFGMDVRGAWRNLPAVYALKDSDEQGVQSVK
jgi:hypoxanthine phosphoribosyltransferase